MRFYFVGVDAPSWPQLHIIMRSIEPSLAIEPDSTDEMYAELTVDEQPVAMLESNSPGDDIFDDDLAELVDELNKQDDPARELVLQRLASATSLFAIFTTQLGSEMPELIDLLLNVLISEWPGILQVDEEGLFDHTGRLIALL